MSTAPAYSAYLGGSGIDVGTGIGIDSTLNAVVTGYTQSGSSVPVSNAVPDSIPPNPGLHIFVTKLSSTGTLTNSSVLSGSGVEKGLAIAVEPGWQSASHGYDVFWKPADRPWYFLVLPLIPHKVGFQPTINPDRDRQRILLTIDALRVNLHGQPRNVPRWLRSRPRKRHLGGPHLGSRQRSDCGNIEFFQWVRSERHQLPLHGGHQRLSRHRESHLPLQTHAFATQIATTTVAATATTPAQTAGQLLNSFHIGSNANSEVGTAAAIDNLGNLYAGWFNRLHE